MNEAPKSRLPVWIKALLVVSLAVNLAVAGVFAGAALRNPKSAGAGFNLPLDGFRAINRAMPDDDRAALVKALRARRGALRSGRRDLRESRQEFVAALRAEPFSQDRLDAALDRQAGLWAGMNEMARSILVARIVEMDPEARLEFAGNLERELANRRKPAQKSGQ